VCVCVLGGGGCRSRGGGVKEFNAQKLGTTESLSFLLSAWEYEKEEMETYDEREWICVWSTEEKDFVVVYTVYTSVFTVS